MFLSIQKLHLKHIPSAQVWIQGSVQGKIGEEIGGLSQQVEANNLGL